MKTIHVMAFLCLSLSIHTKSSVTSTKDDFKRHLIEIDNLGREPPTPLGLCEGDCDSDDDCNDDLICFQQGEYEHVSGCLGGTSDWTTGDYCIKPNSSPTSQSNFCLILYWEEGYYWQEEVFERQWCMECRNDSCNIGDQLYIYECGDNNEWFDFVPLDDGRYQI